jgi:hypothetical protein
LAAIAVLFVSNARYVYSDDLDKLPQLTARHVADPQFAGSTFRFDGRVKTVRTIPASSLVIVPLHSAEADLHVDAVVFPGVGSLREIPITGDTVRVTGNLGQYQGKPQIKPLSSAHIQVLPSDCPARSLADVLASSATGQTLCFGPVMATKVEIFKSRRGRRHVRLEFTEPQFSSGEERIVTAGIMFDGEWTDRDVAMLRSGASLNVTARIDEYRGELSLVVKRVRSGH